MTASRPSCVTQASRLPALWQPYSMTGGIAPRSSSSPERSSYWRIESWPSGSLVWASRYGDAAVV